MVSKKILLDAIGMKGTRPAPWVGYHLSHFEWVLVQCFPQKASLQGVRKYGIPKFDSWALVITDHLIIIWSITDHWNCHLRHPASGMFGQSCKIVLVVQLLLVILLYSPEIECWAKCLPNSELRAQAFPLRILEVPPTECGYASTIAGSIRNNVWSVQVLSKPTFGTSAAALYPPTLRVPLFGLTCQRSEQWSVVAQWKRKQSQENSMMVGSKQNDSKLI